MFEFVNKKMRRVKKIHVYTDLNQLQNNLICLDNLSRLETISFENHKHVEIVENP